MEPTTLKLNGDQEKFTQNFGYCNYDCYLQRFQLQAGMMLVRFARHPNKDYYNSEEYYAVANKGDKHIKLINKYGNRMHKEFCQDLNKRFAKSWKVRFV